jgi:hypothetical protein
LANKNKESNFLMLFIIQNLQNGLMKLWKERKKERKEKEKK